MLKRNAAILILCLTAAAAVPIAFDLSRDAMAADAGVPSDAGANGNGIATSPHTPPPGIGTGEIKVPTAAVAAPVVAAATPVMTPKEEKALDNAIGTAIPSPTPPAPSTAEEALAAARAGQWPLALSIMTMLVVGGVRKSDMVSKSKLLSWGANFMTGSLAIIIVALKAHAAFSFGLVWGSLAAGFGTAGMLELYRDVKDAWVNRAGA